MALTRYWDDDRGGWAYGESIFDGRVLPMARDDERFWLQREAVLGTGSHSIGEYLSQDDMRRAKNVPENDTSLWKPKKPPGVRCACGQTLAKTDAAKGFKRCRPCRGENRKLRKPKDRAAMSEELTTDEPGTIMGRLLVDNLRGAMAAQDERERQAGAKCGVPYELSDCDWPDAVADEVLVLRQQLTTLTDELDDLRRAISRDLSDHHSIVALAEAHRQDSEDVDRYEAKVATLTEALEKIKHVGGRVCADYADCEHVACSSSYAAWAVADAALRGEPGACQACGGRGTVGDYEPDPDVHGSRAIDMACPNCSGTGAEWREPECENHPSMRRADCGCAMVEKELREMAEDAKVISIERKHTGDEAMGAYWAGKSMAYAEMADRLAADRGECQMQPHLSRVCERGTLGCAIKHAAC